MFDTSVDAGALIGAIGLGGKPMTTFGRHEECADVALRDSASVSRRHAAICHGRSPGDEPAVMLVLIDHDSANGTFTGPDELRMTRARAGEPTPLSNGTIIRFGESSRTYVVRGLPTASPALTSRATRVTHEPPEAPAATASATEAELIVAPGERTSRWGPRPPPRASQPGASATTRAVPATAPSQADQKRRSLWSRKRGADDQGDSAHWQAAATSLGEGAKFLRLMGARPAAQGAPANPFHSAHVAEQSKQVSEALERNYNAAQSHGRSKLGLGSF